MKHPRERGPHFRILWPAAFTLVAMVAPAATARPAQAAARPIGAIETAAAATRLADAGRYAAAESLLATQSPPPDSGAALDREQAALERARLHARQHAPGMCDRSWLWRPARVLAALERAHARPAELALAWAERSRIEYRLGAWPAAVASGSEALAVLDRARERAAPPRYRAQLALAEVIAGWDAPRAHAHLAAADSLAAPAGPAAARERPRHLRVAGAIAIMDGDMPGAARLLAACAAAADSLDPPADAEAGLALVLQGYAEGFSSPALGETHRAAGRARLERTVGLGDERTLQGLGRSVSNLRDPALMPALSASLERAQAWLGEHDRREMSAAWDVDYFQSRIKIQLGRYDESLELLAHALDVCRRWQGPDNIREMTTRTDLGIVRWLQKDTTRAMTEFDRVLELSARFPVSIPNDPNLPRNYLGMAMVGRGRLPEAREQFGRMWEGYRDRYGEAFRLASLPATQAARCSRALGDSAAAELWYARAMLPFASGENGTREEVANVRSSYALFLYGSGQWRKAFAHALESAKVRREVVDETVPWLPENDALWFANYRRQDQQLLASLLLREPGAAPGVRCQAWTEVALNRGAVLEAMLRRTPRAGARDTLAESLRRELAAMVLASVRAAETRAAAAKRDSLRAEIARREAAAGGAAAAPLRAGEMARRLGSGALVSYLRTGINEKRDMVGDINFLPHEGYVAFVLAGGDSVPRAHWIGTADSVDAAVRAWRGAWAPGGSAAALAAAGERLRRLVWDPLLAELPAAGDVWLVPDGELQKVNFYALPSGPGRFLADEPRLLHRIGAERDLLASPSAAKADGVLAFGGVDYDRAHEPVAAAASRGLSALPSCRAFLDERFEPLPATGGEVAAITALARRLPGAGAPLALTGLAADEAAFKRLAPGRRVVHLATHSFCLGPECATGGGAAAVVAQNPLVFSGIALAGANRWQEARGQKEAEDGLLTAEELAGLDLRGTEWLVLSGCESGLGQVQSWEGVFGLPRAGRRAGVRTLVMSLAPVDDEAGALWMRELYEAHFARGEATALAARTASRRVLAWLREAGRAPEPRLWAAFVAQGE